MKTVTATELARNFRKYFNQVELKGEELLVIRNNAQIATITPGPAKMTVREAMSDIYGVISDQAAKDWLKDSRRRKGGRVTEIRNPWAT